MRLEKIYLTGFMTSGKSTIGPILANVLGWNFYDLDDEIVNSEGKEIVDIFKLKGEKYFRRIETENLIRLSKIDKSVISLGGGTVIRTENLDIIHRSGKMIYLRVAPNILYKRLRNKVDRPLFRDFVLSELPQEEFVRKIEQMLTEREKFYKLADYTIDTTNVKLGITVDKIAKIIRRFPYEKN